MVNKLAQPERIKTTTIRPRRINIPRVVAFISAVLFVILLIKM